MNLVIDGNAFLNVSASIVKNMLQQDKRIGEPAAMPADPSQPIVTIRRAIPLDWTDYNGHMNEARYLQAFGDATDRMMEIVGCDADYIANGGSYFKNTGSKFSAY